MKFLCRRYTTLLIASIAFAAHAEDLAEFTSRSVTDPLIRISTSTTLLPESDDSSIGARRDEDHKPPIYKKALGKFNVFMLEPFSREKPAEIDFSPVTMHSSGKLLLYIRNHPYGDFKLELAKGDEIISNKVIGGKSWESFSIPYDHEPVILKTHANGWHYEHAFISYGFSTR